MITREDLNGKSMQEVQEMLEKSNQEYIVEIASLTEEEILQREQELMKTMEGYDGYLKNVSYTLPEQCMFDGQAFTKKTIGSFIADFVDTQDVEWSYTLGMYEMVKLWKNKDLTSINYSAYDSTLRVLGQLKYKSFENWKRILAINEFLGSCHDEYVMDTNYMIYLSQTHNALIDALKKFNPDVEEKDQNYVTEG